MEYDNIINTVITIILKYLGDKCAICLLKTCKTYRKYIKDYNVKDMYSYDLTKTIKNVKIDRCAIISFKEYIDYLQDDETKHITTIAFRKIDYDISKLKENIINVEVTTSDMRTERKINLSKSVKSIVCGVGSHVNIKTISPVLESCYLASISSEHIPIIQKTIKNLSIPISIQCVLSGAFDNLIHLHICNNIYNSDSYKIIKASMPKLEYLTCISIDTEKLNNIKTNSHNHVRLTILNYDTLDYSSFYLPDFIKTLVMRNAGVLSIYSDYLLNLKIYNCDEFSLNTINSLNVAVFGDLFNHPINNIKSKEIYLGKSYQCNLKLWDGVETLHLYSTYHGKISNIPKALKKVYVSREINAQKKEVKLKRHITEMFRKYIEYYDTDKVPQCIIDKTARLFGY